jgi:O-methyltransferase
MPNLRLLMMQSLYPLRHVFPRPLYVNKPISSWPPILGLIHDIGVPRAIRPNLVVSPASSANIKIILELVERVASVPGDLAECGVFRGASLVPTAIFLKQKRISRHIFGFDSFQGFDDSVRKDVALGGEEHDDKTVGGLSETSTALVRDKLRLFGVEEGVTLVPGYFRDTLATCANTRFSFVHLDCDIYDSYRDCLSFFYPRLNRGGIILFDEYNDPPWPGCNLAVDEYLADKPEKPQSIVLDNYQKFYIERVS